MIKTTSDTVDKALEAALREVRAAKLSADYEKQLVADLYVAASSGSVIQQLTAIHAVMLVFNNRKEMR